MISFSDRVTMAAITNLVSEKEELSAASSGNSWERLVFELDRLDDKLTNLEILAVRIDEYLSMSAEQLSILNPDVDETSDIRDSAGDIGTTASGVYDSGH